MPFVKRTGTRYVVESFVPLVGYLKFKKKIKNGVNNILVTFSLAGIGAPVKVPELPPSTTACWILEYIGVKGVETAGVSLAAPL